MSSSHIASHLIIFSSSQTKVKDLQSGQYVHNKEKAISYSQFTGFLVDCNVGGLEVAMDDTSRVHILQEG